MDIYSLVCTNMQQQERPRPMDARAEDRYYAEQAGWPVADHHQRWKAFVAILSLFGLGTRVREQRREKAVLGEVRLST